MLGQCSVQFSHVQLFVTPCTAARQASLSITNSWTLLKLMSIKWVMPSNNLILCCSLLLLPSIFPSIKVFSNGSALCIKWPRYWTLNFSITPSDKYSEFDLLAIQGSLKSLLQDNSSKSSIQRSDFFIVQLLHLYMTTRKTIALTVWNFVGLCFLICCLGLSYFPSKKKVSFNFMLAVTICSDFGAQENKVCHCFHCFPSICHEVMGPNSMILVF